MQTRRVFGAVLLAFFSISGCTTAVAGDPVADPRATRASDPNEAITLTVMAFAGSDYKDRVADFQRDHRNVTVVVQEVELAAYYDKLRTMLAAGQLPDVVVVGDELRAEFFDESDLFADLGEVGPDVDEDRWLDWKYKGGFDKNDTLRGYGSDIGPYGMAYRTDLFAAAGLPTDPAQVGELFKSWGAYFSAGDQYVQATGKPWFSSSTDVFTPMQNQLKTTYFDEDGKLVIETNKEVRAVWDMVTFSAGRGQSAKLKPFSPEWNAGFASGAFATVPAPYWMLNLIESNAGPANAGKWAIADSFPGGSANWGGTYLAVPAQSKHPEQAAELAAWMTAPEQQLAVFQAKKAFPAQVDALESTELTGATNDYFATRDAARRYAELATEVPLAAYQEPRDNRVQNEAIWPALEAVEEGNSRDGGWQQAVSEAKKIAGG